MVTQVMLTRAMLGALPIVSKVIKFNALMIICSLFST